MVPCHPIKDWFQDACSRPPQISRSGRNARRRGLLPTSALALAGPYAFKQGAYDVTVVSDGTLSLNLAAVFPGAPVDEVKKLLGPAVAGEEASVEVNVLLLKSGSDTS